MTELGSLLSFSSFPAKPPNYMIREAQDGRPFHELLTMLRATFAEQLRLPVSKVTWRLICHPDHHLLMASQPLARHVVDEVVWSTLAHQGPTLEAIIDDAPYGSVTIEPPSIEQVLEWVREIEL